MPPHLKKVPEKLHRELSEYSSLIRALRTSSTLDLASQLTRIPSPSSGTRSPSPTLPKPSVGISASVDSNYKPGQHIRTRWPLLVQDVFVPEWQFEDEVQSIAEAITRTASSGPQKALEDLTTRTGDNLCSSSLGPVEWDDSALLSTALTLHSSKLLFAILDLLSAHWPVVQKSMYNRLRPMDWIAVLDIVGAAGLVDITILENAKRRMEAIYGPSGSQVISRMQVVATSKRKLEELEAKADQEIFEFKEASPTEPRNKKKK